MEDNKVSLLENQLDALDRLFDGKSSVMDTYLVTFATAQALRTDPLFLLLDQAATALLKIVRSDLSVEAGRDEALSLTNELRARIAELLP